MARKPFSLQDEAGVPISLRANIGIGRQFSRSAERTMNYLKDPSLPALLLGTLTIAALHALIPSHWLAFALVGRAKRWPMRRTLLVTALAGTGHALLTTILGLLVASVGKGLLRAIPPQAEHAATSGILILLGLYFLIPPLRGVLSGRRHSDPDAEEAHDHAGHSHADHSPDTLAQRLGSAPSVMGILVLGMTLSPCLDLLSVYVAAASLPWPSLLTISLLMTTTTVAIMALLVWLALHGLELLRLSWLERNEGLVVGVLLIALGVLLLFLK
jgi:nickel/cobalt exporter